MSCSSDEEADSYHSKKHIKFLIDLVGKFISKALSAQNPAEPTVEAAIETGKENKYFVVSTRFISNFRFCFEVKTEESFAACFSTWWTFDWR